MYFLGHGNDRLFLGCIDVAKMIQWFPLRTMQHIVALRTTLFTRTKSRIVSTIKSVKASRVDFDENSSICDRKFLEITALLRSMRCGAIWTTERLSSYEHQICWWFFNYYI